MTPLKEKIVTSLGNLYRKQGLEHDANRFFWILFFVSHILVVLTWIEFYRFPLILDHGWELPDSWRETRDALIEGYRYILMAYVGVNEVARVRMRETEIKTPGFYMVAMWVLTFFVIGALTLLYEQFIMPEKILIIVRDVVGIYFGGEVIKTTLSKTSKKE